MGFIDGFKQGLSGEPDSQVFEVAGVPVTCHHCGGGRFEEGSALLNTPGLTFLGFDWANREASVLICERCGAVQWFLQEPTQVPKPQR